MREALRLTRTNSHTILPVMVGYRQEMPIRARPRRIGGCILMTTIGGKSQKKPALRSKPQDAKIRETHRPTPQNTATVLRMSKSVEIAGTAFKMVFAIAVMAISYWSIALKMWGVGLRTIRAQQKRLQLCFKMVSWELRRIEKQ